MPTYEERISNIETEYSAFRKLLNVYETGLQNKGWENSNLNYTDVCLNDFATVFDNLKYVKPNEITGCSYFDYPMYCRSFDQNKNISFGVTPDIGFTKNVQLDIDTMTYLPTTKEKYKAYKVSEVQKGLMKSALNSTTSKGGTMYYAIETDSKNNEILKIYPNEVTSIDAQPVNTGITIPDPFYRISYTFFVLPRNENYMNNLFVFAVYYRSAGLSLYVTSDFFHWNTHQILPKGISSADAKLFINTTSSSLSLSSANARIIEDCLLKYFHVLPNNQYMIMYPYQMYKQDGEYKNAMSVLYSPYQSEPLMVFNDPYTDNDWENKAQNGISAFLNFNGEYVMYYNNRANCPISLGLGTVTNSAMLKNNGDVINVPKVAKWFNIYNASGDTVFDLSTVESGKKPVLECAITTLNSISGKYSTDNFPAAMVSIATGDIKNVNETGASEEFNDYRSLVLYLEKQSEYMGNIDEDLSSNLNGNFDSDIMENAFDSKIDNNMKIKYEKVGNVDDYIIRSTDFGNTLIETNRKEHHQIESKIGFLPQYLVDRFNYPTFKICCGNGKYIILPRDEGQLHIFYYSTDGIHWTEIDNGLNAAGWRVICYGNDKFVIIGGVKANLCYAAYSTDGITWTETSNGLNDRYWYSICYGKDKYVAVAGYSNTFAYSSDGINWTETTNGLSSREWQSVCYGNGKYVAVSQSNTFAYSTDGINWTEISNGLNDRSWYSVCYGNGKYVVASGSSSNTFAYSTNGINWTETSHGLNDRVGNSICYGNGIFIASSNTYSIYYSTDGIIWENYEVPTNNGGDICYNNGKFTLLEIENITDTQCVQLIIDYE